MRCLERNVRKKISSLTYDPGVIPKALRWFVGPRPNLVVCFVFGLSFIQAIANAQEPVLNLAMATVDRGEHRVIHRDNPSPVLKTFPSLFFRSSTSMGYHLTPDKELPPVKAVVMEKSRTRETRNPLKLFHSASQPSHCSTLWTSASIQAGYGDIYPDYAPGIYGRNGTGWQEPSCGYVKVHFRF